MFGDFRGYPFETTYFVDVLFPLQGEILWIFSGKNTGETLGMFLDVFFLGSGNVGHTILI